MSLHSSRRSLWMKRLADEVIRGLQDRIRSGDLAEGDAIPEPDALAAEFITSRGVVDRALDDLADDGWITPRGEDRFAVVGTPPDAKGFAVAESFGETLDDVVAVLELRVGVEAVSAALAAQRRNDSDMKAIQMAQASYEKAAGQGAEGARADYAFHHAIAAASGNPYVLDLLEYLGPLLIPRMRLSLPDGGTAGQGTILQASLQEHAAIVAAIEAGDADAARVAMRQHLKRTTDLVASIK